MYKLAIALMLTTSMAMADNDFSFTVMDVFQISRDKVDVLITGRIETGSVSVGDAICLHAADGNTPLTVSAISFQGRTDTAQAGDIGGIGVKDIERDDVRKGDTLSATCD